MLLVLIVGLFHKQRTRYPTKTINRVFLKVNGFKFIVNKKNTHTNTYVKAYKRTCKSLYAPEVKKTAKYNADLTNHN